jgi:hypothetical protein
MKLPITYEQFKKNPATALMFCLLFVVVALYARAESQSKTATLRCEKRLEKCETELRKMSKMLKTQDSLCSALITEIKIYRTLGKI